MRVDMKRLLCLILVMGCLCGLVPAGQAAVTELPEEVFLTQIGSGTCTLCSAAMMIRSTMYINGNDAWPSVTQETLRSTAWMQGVGLKWSFGLTTESWQVQVAFEGVKGVSTEELKAILDQHPEGIVLYCKSVPHAVFLFGYEGDVFYCAETVKGYSEKRITLEESWLGKKLGSQERILNKVSAYWYVSSYEDASTTNCDCQEELAGIYRVTTNSSNLLVRGGHGSDYSVVGNLPKGAEVIVTKATGSADTDWVHVSYNGVFGYSSMKYLTKVGELHEYESVDHAPTCTQAGFAVHTCVKCGHSYEEIKTEALGHSFGAWTPNGDSGKEIRECSRCGETEQRDATWMGTVTGNRLRIRSGPGTGYEVKGYLMVGDRVEILEQKKLGATIWGRTEKGWISMDYVKLDEPVAEPEPPTTEPPTTEPPTTEPPTTEPPTTEPPTTEPPTTEPPTTEPPTTEPPTTEPPTTEPPTTVPPTTEPEPEGILGTVTGSRLRIRSGPGTGHEVLGYVNKGDRVEILEMKATNGMTWGRTEKGWIGMDYVELDQPEENEPEQNRIVTVNTDCLRIRSNAGTGYKIVGYLYRGAKVEITEEKTVNGMTWGKTSQGWISMDYVK